MLVTLRHDPTVRTPLPYTDHPDSETAYRTAHRSGWDESSSVAWAAWTLGLATADGENGPILWTILEVRQLRSMHIEYAMGYFVGDRER